MCHLVTLIFDLCTSTPKVHEYIFPPHIFCVFCSPICSNSFLVFCEYHERKKPLNAKTFSCVRAYKKNGKIQMFWWWNGHQGSLRNECFEDKKRRGRLIVLNKVAKIVLKKVRYIYIRDNLTRLALTIVSKPCLEQFHEKQRLEAPETVSKPQLSWQNNDQFVSNFKVEKWLLLTRW